MKTMYTVSSKVFFTYCSMDGCYCANKLPLLISGGLNLAVNQQRTEAV